MLAILKNSNTLMKYYNKKINIKIMSYKKFLDWNKQHKVQKMQNGDYIDFLNDKDVTDEQRRKIRQQYIDSYINPQATISQFEIDNGDYRQLFNEDKTAFDPQKSLDYYSNLKTNWRDYSRINPETGEKMSLAERRDMYRDERAAARKERSTLRKNDDFMDAVHAQRKENFGNALQSGINSMSGVNFDNLPDGMDADTAGTIGFASKAVSAGVQAIDDITMSDKNFGAQSEAIDQGVHSISSALMKSGNPYAMAAAGAMEFANFATKAGGQNVQGFDVDGIGSGYGNLGHMSSSASRDFGAMIGLGGLNQRAMDRKLQKRNEQAQMALKAANITDQIEFQQEARMNSVENTLKANEMALAGGVDTSLLAAKQGAKLVKKAQNGAKLEEVEVSDKPSIIPDGSMHKNKHDIDLDNITKKGIPVITVANDNVQTLEEIQQQEDTIVQHAEIEEAEIIFSKELTDYVESLREQWNQTNDNSICLEAGKRLAKEIVENTDDNAEITDNAKSQYLKKGSKIRIKKSHKGLFTKYCNGKVTEECIQKGKNSPDPAVRKRATFADNARHFKHDWGGSLLNNGTFYSSIENPTYEEEEETNTQNIEEEFFKYYLDQLGTQENTPVEEATPVRDRSAWLAFANPEQEIQEDSSTGSAALMTSSGSRGFRNNNPLNIRINPKNNWVGKIANNSDHSFEQFDTMEHGYRAAGLLIKNKIKEGLDTLTKLIQSWAPASDGNSPDNYAMTVSKRTGIGVNDKLDPNDIEQLIKVVQAMTFVENGKEGDLAQIQAGIRMLS